MLIRTIGVVAIATVFCAVHPTQAYAAVVYDEAVSGDFSDSGLSPTPISVAVGSNEIRGTTGRPGAVPDRDYFTITVPSGLVLSALTVLPGTMPGNLVSFIGLQAGNQVTLPVTTTTATGLLGYWLYSTSDINTDILDDMARPANGSSGFSTPLGAGSYAFWVQEVNIPVSPYGFDIVLAAATAVPEPTSIASMMAGVVGLGLARRRRVKPQPGIVHLSN